MIIEFELIDFVCFCILFMISWVIGHSGPFESLAGAQVASTQLPFML